VTKAARKVGLNISTAKVIIRNHRKEQRELKEKESKENNSRFERNTTI